MYVISYLFPRSKSDSIQFDIMTSLINALELQILRHQLQPLTRCINLWGLWMQCRQNIAWRLSKLADSVVGASLIWSSFSQFPQPCPPVGSTIRDLSPSATREATSRAQSTHHKDSSLQTTPALCLQWVPYTPTGPPASCPTCPGWAIA